MIRPMHFGNAWDFLCRALSESKLKAQLELSANDTCALKEDELKAKYEFSETGRCKLRNKPEEGEKRWNYQRCIVNVP